MTKIISTLTERQVRQNGWKALVKELGLSGASRFLRQYEDGEGNYTEARKSIFAGKTVKEIADEIKKK